MTETPHQPSRPGTLPSRLRSLVTGEGVKARAARSSVWTLAKFGGENGMRLVSNLILTRLLFPEAFGLMAIVHVFTAGLQMVSETGVRASIIQHARGDDQDFLDTAWTIQVIRGVLLWLGASTLAFPAAEIYDEPMLLQLLPVAGLGVMIAGFNPTRVITANRNLQLGRLTVLDLVAQVLVILVMVSLALIFRSVWALVLGGVLGSVLRVGLFWAFLPGRGNRFAWDRPAARDMFHFGKYMTFGSAAGFVVNNADKAILGAFVSLGTLGVYNIGYFLASMPQQVQQRLVNRVLFPLYRMKEPLKNEEDRRKLFRVRRLLIASMLTLNALLGAIGVALVDLMYDDRYAGAGAVVVLFSLSMVPRICLGNYTSVLLAHGDSRRDLFLTGSAAILQTVFLFVGIHFFGIVGAILSPGLAALATSPLRVTYAARYRAVDSTDIPFLLAGLTVGLVICWLHWGSIAALLP